MKIILVTGGNRGIGLEICRQLDQAGHQVIMGSRNLSNGLKAAQSLSERVTVKQLDITDITQVEDVFEYVKSDFGRLDVLINNAGIGTRSERNENSVLAGVKNMVEKNFQGAWRVAKKFTPIMRNTGMIQPGRKASGIPMDIVKFIMETNLYGAWRMIQVFIPLLSKSSDARIINISSGLGELKSLSGEYPGYSISKASLNALTIMFSNELKEKGIRVNAMCPGWVKTDMGGPDAPRNVSQGADTAVWLATEEQFHTGKFFRDRKEINW